MAKGGRGGNEEQREHSSQSSALQNKARRHHCGVSAKDYSVDAFEGRCIRWQENAVLGIGEEKVVTTSVEESGHQPERIQGKSSKGSRDQRRHDSDSSWLRGVLNDRDGKLYIYTAVFLVHNRMY